MKAHCPSLNGFALIITLVMVTLAAIIAVTLLSSASLERATATNVSDRYHAELATQTGLEAAKNVLMGSPVAGPNAITADDDYMVLRVDGTQGPNSIGNHDAYYYLARPEPSPTANLMDIYPLFWGPPSPPPAPIPIDHIAVPAVTGLTAPAAPFPSPAQEPPSGTPTRLYPQLYSFQQPAYTQWQEIRDPKDSATPPEHLLPFQRYTLSMEEAQAGGYLDASVVGNEDGTSATHQRSAGSNTNEIALFTLFDKQPQSDPGTPLAQKLIDYRSLLFSTPTIKQLTTSDVAQANTAVRLGLDTDGERSLIPFGFGYKDEGMPKTNLNTVISDTSTSSDDKVAALAKTINDNLPQFSNRKEAYPAAQDYVSSLVANMIDYADADSDPTLPATGANYRGVDSYPYLIEFFDRYNWDGPTNYYAKDWHLVGKGSLNRIYRVMEYDQSADLFWHFGVYRY